MTQYENPIKSEALAETVAMTGLTHRQQQILELMQQGKINKEIASDLDISLGTVKQHLVAIFKRLKVQNRTMAVARLAEFKDQSGFDAVFAQETLIARRPAIVLSIKIDSQLPQTAMKLFHTCMAEMAFDGHALFISREHGDGDLIFGLKRSSTQDIRTAIQVAERVFYTMKSYVLEQFKEVNPKEILTGALVAGLISVSQNRFGGWSGETVGSHLLTWAHKLRANASASCLIFDSQVISVMQAFDLTVPSSRSNLVLFSELNALNRWDIANDLPLVGRYKELESIRGLLAEKYRVLLLEGESGMGKSRLCREAARLAVKEGWKIFYIHVLPSGIFDSEDYQYLEHLDVVFSDMKCTKKSLLVIDDAHHLTAESKELLTSFLNSLPEGNQAIVCGRKPQRYTINETLHSFYKLLSLDRLDEASIISLIKKSSGKASADIVERARGVPLFAKELLQSTDENPVSLALMITIASRIDKFKVDWKLLYCVASYNDPISLERLSSLIQDDLSYIKAAIENAEALGILAFRAGVVSFRHPLVKTIISSLFRPNLTTNVISRYS